MHFMHKSICISPYICTRLLVHMYHRPNEFACLKRKSNIDKPVLVQLRVPLKPLRTPHRNFVLRSLKGF